MRELRQMARGFPNVVQTASRCGEIGRFLIGPVVSVVFRAMALAGLLGAFAIDRAQAQDLYANPSDAYEILFSRILQNPSNSTLNRQFAREAEARGDLRLAFAALERVVLSSPGDTLAQAEFDRLRNKMMPAVTLVTVTAGASYVSNPLQLPSKEYLIDNNSPLERGTPFSPHRPDDASFNASVAVADERSFGHLRWRTLALAQGQVQADVSELDSPMLAIATGPVFWLNPNLWMHVAGGADIVWLDGDRLYNGVSAGVTFGGLYRGLTQTLTARYDWRNGNDALVADDAQIFDLQGRFVLSPSLVKADLFYFLPRLQISLNDTNPIGFIPETFNSFYRPLFPGDFTELGGAAAYYFPLFTGRMFLGAGIGVFERWYNESASSLRTVNVNNEPVPVNSGDRRDTYVEPTAHVIFPNLFGPRLDLRFDYRFEHNVSNASMTTTLKNDAIVRIPFDYDNHVAGVHVVGRF
jgi:hypothetical protein